LSALEQAMAQLIESQALFAAQQAHFAVQHAILQKESIALKQKLTERFERIEALLLQHDRMLRDLPEAIRKKTGYQQK
jgi:hypothetical protein